MCLIRVWDGVAGSVRTAAALMQYCTLLWTQTTAYFSLLMSFSSITDRELERYIGSELTVTIINKGWEAIFYKILRLVNFTYYLFLLKSQVIEDAFTCFYLYFWIAESQIFLLEQLCQWRCKFHFCDFNIGSWLYSGQGYKKAYLIPVLCSFRKNEDCSSSVHGLCMGIF